MPLADHNLLISINENELYFTKSPNGSRILEKCGHNVHTVYALPCRGTIRIDPECAIKTSSYIIQAHKIKRINAANIITPTISTFNISDNYIQQLTFIKTLNLSTSESIVIHNRGEISPNQHNYWPLKQVIKSNWRKLIMRAPKCQSLPDWQHQDWSSVTMHWLANQPIVMLDKLPSKENEFRG